MKIKKKAIKKLRNSQINTPHDKLFKKAMQIPKVATEWLMLHLPDDLKNKVDYKTLTVIPETFIDETLSRSQVDALFSVKCEADDLLIYVLVEQQSQADDTMPTRRLSYKSDIWAYILATQKKDQKQIKLPPIVDLHFYTGPQPYTGPLSLGCLAGDNAELINQSLTRPMINVWAGDVNEDQLKNHPWAATLEYIMANRRKRDLRKILRNIAPNIRLFYLEKQNAYVLSLYTYIENVYTCSESMEEFAHIAGEEISTKAEEDIMTMAEQMRHKGREEGREEGRLENAQNIAKKLLAEGTDPVFVAKITDLSLVQVKKLKEKMS